MKNKILEVREFDSITGNPEYEGSNYYKYLPQKTFEELVHFIHEFSGDEESTDVTNFMGIRFKRNVGDIVTVKNYVGLIQMDSGYQIQILPKINFGDGEDSLEKTKRVFLKMLRCMKDFPSKVFSEASINVDRMNLYEIFINMYIQEVRQLVKHGIKSDYIREDNNLNFFKGKLLVNEHIKKNIAHKERFYVEYDEYNTNRPENRLIKSTLLKLQNLTSNAKNSKEIRQLLTSFELVDQSLNYDKDFSSVRNDRSTKDYENIIPWSRVFLKNKSFSTFTGSNHSRALLFPMEKIYEGYVAHWVKKIMVPCGWHVSTQDKGYYLFNEPRKQFSLIPDIVLQKDNRKIIMDTKWKRLSNKEKNYGIATDDMYQMYAYSKKYNNAEIWLLYPVNDEMRNHERITFKSEDNVVVNVFFVDVANIEDSINELRERIC